jgi:uncharacterized protein YidB (DUF937 family)
MGFFDDLKKGVMDQILGGGEQQKKLMDLAAGLITNRESGGLAGLAQLFNSKGLGDAISSWIGTGANQPVTSDQIINVIGRERIQQYAEKVGLSSEDISRGLASMLPQIIDHLTPHGQVPDPGALEQGLAALKDRLSRA